MDVLSEISSSNITESLWYVMGSFFPASVIMGTCHKSIAVYFLYSMFLGLYVRSTT